MKTIAFLLHNHFEQAEYEEVNNQLKAKGRTLTAYHTLQLDLENAGAKFVDESVQVDSTLITSRTPDDISNFVAAIDKALA